MRDFLMAEKQGESKALQARSMHLLHVFPATNEGKKTNPSHEHVCFEAFTTNSNGKEIQNEQ
jgi:hypothetical protein